MVCIRTAFYFLLAAPFLAVGLQAAHADEAISYTYDSLGRLVAARSTGAVNNNQVASYCYDAAGNRLYAEMVTTGIAVNCATVPTPTPTPSIPRPPTLSINSGAATEGGTIAFTITLSAVQSATVTVDYGTVTGTALLADYSAASGTLVFASGQTSKTVVVTTTQDTKVENTELFYVNLSNPTGGAYVDHGSGAGSIIDDDQDPCPQC